MPALEVSGFAGLETRHIRLGTASFVAVVAARIGFSEREVAPRVYEDHDLASAFVRVPAILGERVVQVACCTSEGLAGLVHELEFARYMAFGFD